MRDMCHHKRNLEAWTIPFQRSQDEETIEKPKETPYHFITYPSQQYFQWYKDFLIFIMYEKVMPSLVNLFNTQICPKISPPQSFVLFSKSFEIPKRDLIYEQMKCLIFCLYRSSRKVSTSNWANMQFKITNN